MLRLRSHLRRVIERARERAADHVLALITRRIPLPPQVRVRRVILVGASVAREWRLHLVFPRISTRVIYDWDKTPLVEEALRERPDAIILKQCAAYFPLPGVRREIVQGWVARIQAAGVHAVLATVVPVTRRHAASRPGRAEGLWAFNDWVREYCETQGVPLLDLEAALRCSVVDRHLDDWLDSGDGLHLSRRTYRRQLDGLIPPLLLRTFDLGSAALADE